MPYCMYHEEWYDSPWDCESCVVEEEMEQHSGLPEDFFRRNNMGDLTRSFSRWEFACKCGCGFDTVDTVLLSILQHLRDHWAKPIAISSGCRCPKYNASKEVKGYKNSQHKRGRAADFTVKDVLPKTVQKYLIHILDSVDEGNGIGSYDKFTHIDTRSGKKARWTGT